MCDTDNDCPNAAFGACTAVPGVYYIDGMGNAGESTGKMGGVAFERGATPGADPKLYETLYSPPPTAGHPIKMPAFTKRTTFVTPHQKWNLRPLPLFVKAT